MSLKDVTIDLSPLTIFIGPNASGKSAIFKALVTVSKLLGTSPVSGPFGEFNLEPAVTLDHLVWQGNSGLPIIFQLWWPDDSEDEPGYTLKIEKQARGWSVTQEKLKLAGKWFDSAEDTFEHDTEKIGKRTWKAPYRATLCHLVAPFIHDKSAAPAITPLLEFKQSFGEAWRYRISANDIASFVKIKEPRGSEQVYMRENGRGLSLELQRLQGLNRPLFSLIEQELNLIFPHIRFINFQSERFGVGLAFTTDRSEDLVPGSEESDGVLLTTFLLWRLFTAPKNLKVCLEEPENGLHPYLLSKRIALLKKFAYEKIPLQLLVATHSPDFLSALEDRRDMLEMIRVVEFSHSEGTKVYKLGDMEQIDKLLSVFNDDIGELWWSGAIGAVPTGQQKGYKN